MSNKLYTDMQELLEAVKNYANLGESLADRQKVIRRHDDYHHDFDKGNCPVELNDIRPLIDVVNRIDFALHKGEYKKFME